MNEQLNALYEGMYPNTAEIEVSKNQVPSLANEMLRKFGAGDWTCSSSGSFMKIKSRSEGLLEKLTDYVLKNRNTALLEVSGADARGRVSSAGSDTGVRHPEHAKIKAAGWKHAGTTTTITGQGAKVHTHRYEKQVGATKKTMKIGHHDSFNESLDEMVTQIGKPGTIKSVKVHPDHKMILDSGYKHQASHHFKLPDGSMDTLHTYSGKGKKLKLWHGERFGTGYKRLAAEEIEELGPDEVIFEYDGTMEDELDEARERTPSYRMTYHPGDEDSEKGLAAVKAEVKAHNKAAGPKDKVRVTLKGRLGKDNPAAAKYKKGGEKEFSSDYHKKLGIRGPKNIDKADAKHHDVYVHNNPDWRRQ